jgi:glucose/arabinose dehydrogenase
MRLSKSIAALAVLSLLASDAHAQLRADVYVSGLTNPLAFVQDPADPAVQYVVEQGGRIRVIQNGVLQAGNFLDLSSQISTGGERGLLGLAFAPDYASSGRLFVNFTNIAGHTVIARFRRSTGNPLAADPASRFDLRWSGGTRFIAQPFSNHNGGTLVFGPDGYLYIGMGDGGSSNDPAHRAQDPNTLLGKMLRVDVNVGDSNADGYSIPPDNPFLSNVPVAALPEIWAFGLRNPWKFSFDDPAHGGSGALLIADVGQGAWEEIDYQPPARGGRNYGWRNREGAHDNVTTLPPAYLPLIDPVFEYDRATGQSITGGYVYRGAALGANFTGRYFFADFVAGRVWSIALTVNPSTGEASASGLLEHTAQLGGTSTLGNISSLGVDSRGELYVVSWSRGVILRVLAPVPQMSLDAPAAGQLSQPFLVGGWALDQSAASGTGVDAVHVWAHSTTGGGSTFLGAANLGGSRPDVASIFGSQFQNSGFGLVARGLTPGGYRIVAYAHSAAANAFTAAREASVTVTLNPRMTLDLPAAGTLFSPFRVAGWALDLAAASGTGVDAVHVWAFPSAGNGVFLGVASYGGSRPDVGGVFGSQFTNSGFNLLASGLAPGSYTLVAYAHSSLTGTFNDATLVPITIAASAQMAVDIPAPGATVARPFRIAGWALDRAAASGTGVDVIDVWAYPIAGGGPIYLGGASYGGSRPDVGGVFGSQFTNSGFNLTATVAAPGGYDIVVFARSTVAGTFNNARVVRITVN